MKLKFNFYGFIIGLAIVIASSLIENKLKNEELLSKYFYKIGIFVLIFAIIGARLWHVATDYYLYSNNLLNIFKVWNGGLSILGAVLGGIFGLILSFNFIADLKKLSLKNKKNEVLKLLDYSIFGLPIAQAIGRWGNYFNQELYGLPTSGWMKIFIDQAHRFPGYETVEYYHPLFLYESLFTGLFALLLYFFCKKYKLFTAKYLKIGSGKLFIIYVLYYSIVRFFLDFLRIDKTLIFNGFLGTNQIALLLIILVCSLYFIKLRKSHA